MKAEFTLEQVKEFDKKGFRSIAARMVKSLLQYLMEQKERSEEMNQKLIGRIT